MRARRCSVAVAAGLALVLSVSSCGQQDADISPAAAEVLSADVDSVTVAARAGDAAKVQLALRTLGVHVAQQQKSGDLSPARASTILAAGARVALNLGAPPPRVVVKPVPVRVPQERRDGDDEEDEDD